MAISCNANSVWPGTRERRPRSPLRSSKSLRRRPIPSLSYRRKWRARSYVAPLCLPRRKYGLYARRAHNSEGRRRGNESGFLGIRLVPPNSRGRTVRGNVTGFKRSASLCGLLLLGEHRREDLLRDHLLYDGAHLLGLDLLPDQSIGMSTQRFPTSRKMLAQQDTATQLRTVGYLYWNPVDWILEPSMYRWLC